MLCEDISTLMVRGKPVARVTKTKQKEKKNKQTNSLCSLLLNLQHNEEPKCGETNCHLWQESELQIRVSQVKENLHSSGTWLKVLKLYQDSVPAFHNVISFRVGFVDESPDDPSLLDRIKEALWCKEFSIVVSQSNRIGRVIRNKGISLCVVMAQTIPVMSVILQAGFQ